VNFCSDNTLSEKSLNFTNINDTGRIEKGDDSSQKFTYVDIQFESFACATYEYHILPVYSKPVTVNELNVSYCTGCGLRRRKQNWSFCPKCGTKF
jgi:hypothetical protein